MSAHLEVHTHSYVSGPNATGTYQNGFCTKIEHSHEGGDVPHEHPHTGPACYVIDKDRWAARTGLKGGGRKKYTNKPSGPQLPYVERTPEQDTFEIIVCDSSLRKHREQYPGAEGGGAYAAERMVQGHKMTPRLRIEP